MHACNCLKGQQQTWHGLADLELKQCGYVHLMIAVKDELNGQRTVQTAPQQLCVHAPSYWPVATMQSIALATRAHDIWIECQARTSHPFLSRELWTNLSRRDMSQDNTQHLAQMYMSTRDKQGQKLTVMAVHALARSTGPPAGITMPLVRGPSLAL